MTDFRALCEELADNLHRCQCWYIEDNGYGLPDLAALLRRARAALAEDPVGPTLMERAVAGDPTAAKQFLHEAGFTDEYGQWLPQYQPIPETTND
jgi:hypothetical protein